MSDDYYKTLGIERNASQAEIKKAFRKMAQEHHPDKEGGDEVMFKKVNEAYSTLKDEKKRAQYDQFGSAGAQAGFGGGGAGGFGGFQQGGVEFDMSDIFDMFGGGGRRRQRARRGADVSVEITITFAESVYGVEKSFTITKNNTCEVCEGTGAQNKKTKTCTTCNGDGRVAQVQQTIMGTFQQEVICPDCGGIGSIPEKKCSACHGHGVKQGQEEVNVKIPAGIEHGQQLRLANRGEALQGGENGDLYIFVQVTPDKRFEKIGNDIKTDIHVAVPDAVLGVTKKIDTVGESVRIKIPAGTSHGTLLRVKGHGVGARNATRGDLYVQVVIDIPKKLSKEEKKLYEQLQG